MRRAKERCVVVVSIRLEGKTIGGGVTLIFLVSFRVLEGLVLSLRRRHTCHDRTNQYLDRCESSQVLACNILERPGSTEALWSSEDFVDEGESWLAFETQVFHMRLVPSAKLHAKSDIDFSK